jgi:tetratricopeptide (TPR) repeat protein
VAGFLDKLFGKKNEVTVTLTLNTPTIEIGTPSKADLLLKDATAQKQAGDIDKAIETLREAYKELTSSSSVYPINTYLRLPLYLQQAGKNDEAWGEFNKLILWVNTKPRYSPEMTPIDQSIIWDKMRLFLQREGKYTYAIQFAVWSYVSWGVGFYKQQRDGELLTYKTEANIKEALLPIIKKANKQNYINEIVKVVSEYLNTSRLLNKQR